MQAYAPVVVAAAAARGVVEAVEAVGVVGVVEAAFRRIDKNPTYFYDRIMGIVTEMVTEMMTLRPFIRGVQRRTFEDTVTKEMIESAFGYHGLLKNTLKKLKGKRGYTEFKETFKPALVEDEANVEE